MNTVDSILWSPHDLTNLPLVLFLTFVHPVNVNDVKFKTYWAECPHNKYPYNQPHPPVGNSQNDVGHSYTEMHSIKRQHGYSP